MGRSMLQLSSLAAAINARPAVACLLGLNSDDANAEWRLVSNDP